MYVWIEGLSYFHTRSGYSLKGGPVMRKSAERRSGSDRRKVVDPKYLGVKSKRKRGKEPRRKEDRVERSERTGPLGF